MQSRNRDTHVDNKHVSAKEGEEGGRNWEMGLIYVHTVGTIDNQGGPLLRELYPVFFGDLNGREIQKRGDVCIQRADSLCCAAETNTFQGRYAPIQINF